MRIPKIYLETTIFNFFFTDDAPEKAQDTLKLFQEIQEGRYEPYTSDYALMEIKNASEPKRARMLELLDKYSIFSLPTSDDAKRLADIYVGEGIIPEKYFTDALHIAIATVSELDFIVSFNFKHIVKRKTVIMTESVNLREGYRQIGIFSPTEVIENDNE
jgi:predicted nucleic acid-binding protein